MAGPGQENEPARPHGGRPSEATRPHGSRPSSEAARRLRRVLPHALAALVFAWAAAAVYGPVWRAGAERTIPVRPTLVKGLQRATRADVIFEAWLASRHARTLLTAPHRLFHTEHCAPAEKTLTLGIPMITMGVLAIPGYWLTGDPVLTWNLALVLLSLLGAAAMYALVVAWTGVPAAGIAAGLLFAFHPIRLTDVTHPTVWDSTWIVFALLFAERWSARGRWRDAVGLVAAATLQIAASFYPLIAAFFLSIPVLAWLLWRDRLRHVGLAQIAFVAAGVAGAAALLLGPYLGAETREGEGLHRTMFTYAGPGRLAVDAWLFPGWSTLGLAALALVVPRRLALRIHGDPRPALVVGASIVLLVAMGHHARPLPNLHRLFAEVLPGLDAVRVVLRVFSGTHLVLALLAGAGAAAAVRLAGRAGLAMAVALVLVCGFDVLRAPSLGFERSWLWFTEEYRPDADEIAFFAELEARGNRGPILELPVDQLPGTLWVGPPRIMLTLFHGRRTSACFGSYPPAGREALAATAARLPEPEALDDLVGQGFTTVVFRHLKSRPAAYRMMGAVGRAAEQGGRGIEHVYSTRERTAFALLGEAARE